MGQVLKWIGIVLGGLVGLIVIAIVATQVIGAATLNKTYAIPAEALDIPIPTDAESIAFGEHIARSRGCTDCHGEDFSGEVFIDDPMLASISASNLTSGEGGIGSTYSDADWVRAIRHGVRPDGQAVYIMPSNEYWYLSDTDLGALIAYLKTIPAVDEAYPQRRFGPMGRFGVAAGQFPPPPAAVIDHTGPRPPAPEPGVTAGYGQYLTRICTGCHNPDLTGGPSPDDPTFVSPNLTPAGELGGWTQEDFVTAMRTGVTPGGGDLDPEQMPWRTIGRMTDDELAAIWLYLSSLPPMQTPG